MPDEMEYIRTKSGAIQTHLTVPDGKLIVQANDVRKTSSGVHARLKIGMIIEDEVYPVDAHTFNVENGRERKWFAGQVHGKLPFLTRSNLEKDKLEEDLQLFADGLWDQFVGTMRGEISYGNPERREIQFIMRPFVLPEAGTILFAPPKRGKSYMGMMWAVSIDAGVSTLWHVPNPVPVLYINLERSKQSMEYRLGRVNEALGLDAGRGLRFIHARGKSLSDVVDAARATVLDHNIGFVVLDSLSRAGMGRMGEDAPANSAMDAMNSLGCAWMVLGHTPREDETHVFGSQMFDAAADIIVQQRSKEEPGKLVVGLEMKPSNDVPKAPLTNHLFTMEFDAFGLAGVRKATSGESSLVLVDTEDTPLQRIITYVKEHQPTDATTVSEETGIGRSTVSTMFSNRDEFVFVRKEGRKSLYGISQKLSGLTHADDSSEGGSVVKTTSYTDDTSDQRELSEPTHTDDTLIEAHDDPF